MNLEVRERIQRTIQDEAEKFFPDSVRRVTLIQPDQLAELDEQDRRFLGRGEFGPDELVPQVVLTEPARAEPLPEPPGRAVLPAGARTGSVRAPQLLQAFRHAGGSAIRQFRQALSSRLPELRHIWIKFEDADGHSRGGSGVLLLLVADQARRADDSLTAVMVRLRAEELETVDTLITAGIANNRAEAIRWALSRIRERPAYEQLRAHTREIERLKTDF